MTEEQQKVKRILTETEDRKAYDDKMRAEGFVKVRQFLGNGRYAVRWLPPKYQLRVDEELA